MHMAAARLGWHGWHQVDQFLPWLHKQAWKTLLSPSFWAGKAAWAQSGCLPTENADYCMLVNEWAWLR